MTDSEECHPIWDFSFRKSVNLGEATFFGLCRVSIIVIGANDRFGGAAPQRAGRSRVIA